MIIVNPMLIKAVTETVGTGWLWGTGALLLSLVAVLAVVAFKMEKKRGGKQDETLELG